MCKSSIDFTIVSDGGGGEGFSRVFNEGTCAGAPSRPLSRRSTARGCISRIIMTHRSLFESLLRSSTAPDRKRNGRARAIGVDRSRPMHRSTAGRTSTSYRYILHRYRGYRSGRYGNSIADILTNVSSGFSRFAWPIGNVRKKKK